jgi:glycosyltransferase involved in cell wall biosynthesis
VIYNPFARLLHHEGATRGFSQPPGDVLRASVNMYPYIQAGDPYFNPHLSPYQRIPAVAQSKESPVAELILRILRDFDLVSSDDLNAVDPLRWHVQLPYPSKGSANQKRLLVISHELTRTGAPIILWQICTALAQIGYQITVLAPEDGPLHENYLESKIPVLILPSLLKDARVVLPYMQDQDVVLLNTILCYRVAHATKASNLPLLFWVHESSFGQQVCQTLPGAANAIRVADRLVFPSHATANLYTEYSDTENHRVIHSGVNIIASETATSATPFFKVPGKLYIIVIASIEPRKGQDVLLQALKMLPANISNGVECFLIGRQLEMGFSQKVIRSAESLGNVQILGELSAVKVKQYLAAADIFVLPSRDEALPISILEAMAFSKAIIATRVGGMAEIIQDQVNGLLVEKEDPAALADCIARLYLDKNYRYNLGKAAKDTYQSSLTYDRFVEQFKTVIHEIA